MSKIVIIGDSVGQYAKGQVVDISRFPEGEANRLLSIGAARTARSYEIDKEFVDVESIPLAEGSAHRQLTDAHSELDKLRRENAKLNEKIANMNSIPPDYDPMKDQKIEGVIKEFQKNHEDAMVKLKEKDDLIEQLRRQLQEKAEVAQNAVAPSTGPASAKKK